MRLPVLVMLLLLALTPVLSGCRGLTEAEQHYNTGLELYKQGQLEKAIAEYTKAIELDPEMAVAYNDRGAAYGYLDQPQQAIQDLDEAIRLNPQAAKPYYNRGIAYGYLGQPQQAIQDLDEAIRLNPQFADAYANRAFAYTLLNMDAEAEQDFERAEELGFDAALLKAAIEQLKQQR